ncbi:MAG: DUF4339 domain-containing protein [Bacteroidales bacterium]|nr:DUF4339 domain-containing protein [Bacteroidales bacterium]MBO5262855.1 DUF4339 domain-containing protein [Bacteroidaceae bacterium]
MNNNFDSIDRLIEFGMSLAVAQQMVATMNYAMTNLAVPKLGEPQNAVKKYFAAIDNAQAGPFNEDEIKELVVKGKITGETLVWRYGLPGWQQAKMIPEVNTMLLLKK